jgi:solute carrier family 45, member 1/2/4
MLLLPWTGDFIAYLSIRFGYEYCSTTALIFRGVVSALLIWALNIAIQPVQMGIRALICETCPLHQKVQATAYASCITGIGSIFGYASGFVNLPLLLPWFGDTQFKCLCVVASLSLGLTTAVTLSLIKEEKMIFDDRAIKAGVGVVDVFRQVYRSVVYMPKDMKRVYQVQFFAWVGWFPFLFYITT